MFKRKNVLKWATPLLILLILGGMVLFQGAFASGTAHIATQTTCTSKTSKHTYRDSQHCKRLSPTATPVTHASPTATPVSPTATAIAHVPTATAVPTATPVVTIPPTATPVASSPLACTTCWHPGLNVTMQWQLSGTVDQSYPATFYDIDLFDNSAAVVTSLHSKGYKVACYIDAGTWENWRSDASQFPASVKGQSNGWPGEAWLDIRQLSVIGPLLAARMDQCKAKGFDAVEFDNVDGYTNRTGFPLTASDQLTFNKWLASQAHARNLSVGLKNDTDQVAQLLPYFDWALDEQCFEYNECDLLLPFVNAGKPVMDVEYNVNTANFCSQANSMNINAQKKSLNLDAPRTLCR
ncbi:MCPVI and Glyco_hydro_114 domain-containing protein [Ktedonobacteria bacterium brp13]|nr:MCPVI and Glyco_hydro_114 domain-containing protein [Ktedonobacteria bacterium brp13]